MQLQEIILKKSQSCGQAILQPSPSTRHWTTIQCFVVELVVFKSICFSSSLFLIILLVGLKIILYHGEKRPEKLWIRVEPQENIHSFVTFLFT